MSSKIWITSTGVRLADKTAAGQWADATCDRCGVAYSRKHPCNCHDLTLALERVRSSPRSWSWPTLPKWVKPVLHKLFRPVPSLSVWVAQLATIFWLEVRTLPEAPENLPEWLTNVMPESGVPYNYLTAAILTAIFALWAFMNIRPRRAREE